MGRSRAGTDRRRRLTPYDLLVANAMSRHDVAAHAVSLAGGWSSPGGDNADELLRERDELVAHAYRTGADDGAFAGGKWTS
jgi:xylulose-5-phosphate/fructose-6-phosphate phosphoketolase